MTNPNAFIALTCDAVLFDLDGVLVNSAQCVERLLTAWASAHGLSAPDVIRVAHGRRTVETIRLVAPCLDAEAEAATLTAFEATSTDGIFEIAGAKTLVGALPRRWAIVTSGARAVANLRLRVTRLPEPHVLIAAEDVASGKPDPEGYLAAARCLGVAPSACLVVEDAPAGLAAARAAGMQSVGVAGTYPIGALSAATYVVAGLTDLQITYATTSMPVTVRFAPA
jgi:sugar-phosphatase